jgi:hypothetical protein
MAGIRFLRELRARAMSRVAAGIAAPAAAARRIVPTAPPCR